MTHQPPPSPRLSTRLDYVPNATGIFAPTPAVAHRDEEYNSRGFDILWKMQLRHFWYRGRHRFLLHALRKAMRKSGGPDEKLTAIDLGGGCGGWVKYLSKRFPGGFAELALADSSLPALERAGTVLPGGVARYQVDLLNLGWRERWDVAFLLDVLEHLPDDKQAMQEVAAALRPGGLVFVTMPALRFFWSYNDELAHHWRRYRCTDLQHLAEATGLRLVTARYFMFFLSPLLWLSRAKPGIAGLTSEEKAELVARSHQVPVTPVNETLAMIFGLETPLGHFIKFPWGTSILGVFQKPK